MFRGSRGVGVFVDGYVEGVTIRDNQVSGTGSSGIYLETGSAAAASRATRSSATGSARTAPAASRSASPGTDLWFWGIGREGISVDGSYENTIVGNALLRQLGGRHLPLQELRRVPRPAPATSSAATPPSAT